MKMFVRYLLPAAVFALLLTSCKSKKKGALDYISKNTSAVITINARQLMNKLTQDGLSPAGIQRFLATGVFDSSGGKNAGAETELLLAASGIDLNQPVHIALQAPVMVTEPFVKVSVILSLSDKDKFAALLKDQDFEMSDAKGITYGVSDEAAVGFDSKTAIYVSAFRAENLTGISTPRNLDFGGGAAAPTEEAAFTGDSAKVYVTEAFGLKSAENITAVKNSGELPIGSNDMRLWMNYETGISNLLRGDLNTAALILSQMVKGSSVAATLNFENGKIVSQARMYFEDDAAKVIKSSSSRSIDLSLLSQFPGSKLNSMVAVSMDLQMIKDILKYITWNGNANAALSYFDLRTDDVLDATTGDMVMAFSDFKFPPLSAMTDESTLMQNTNWAALVKIKNKVLLEKILTAPKLAEKIKKDSGGYVLDYKGVNMYINLQGPVMIISTNPQLAAQYNAGTAKAGFDAAVLSRFKDKAMGVYFSAKSLVEALPPEIKNSTLPKESFIVSAFSELYMSSPKFTDNYMQLDGEMVMTGNRQNSLSHLVFQVMNMVKGMGVGEEDEMPILTGPDAPADDRIKPMEVKPVEAPKAP
jgi:hypothetical protein